MKKWLKRLMWLALGGLVLFIVGAAAAFISNLDLPEHSVVVEKLAPAEKARLREALHLRQAVGDRVWPGWSAGDIPIITYNEKYAFLVGYREPPSGWLKMPQRSMQGGPWRPVRRDDFFGETYYSQQIEPGHTPQSFTVLVGDKWVATMQTREYAKIFLCSDLRKSAPPLVRSIIPYRLIWRALMGETDDYIVALEHESFHSFEGMTAATRLADAENAVQLEGKYPWDDASFNRSWKDETGVLVRAIRAASGDDAKLLASQFLNQRDSRRKSSSLSGELIDYERQREWLEGLAKYTEVSIGQVVASTPGYEPFEGLKEDPDFKNYATRGRYWSRQLNEVGRLMGHSDEKRFYYSGMAQAILLDRLLPGWKQRIFAPGVCQEDLLREAVRYRSVATRFRTGSIAILTRSETR